MGAYGVSVETADQALAAISRPSVASVQIIINAFRIKPLERVLPAALEAGVGIIARVRWRAASCRGDTTSRPHSPMTTTGPTTGTGSPSTGVRPSPVSTTTKACAQPGSSRPAASRDLSPARAALAWVAQLDGVTTVIPGARSPEQARQNATAGSVPPLGAEFTAAVTELYDRRLRASIHDLW